MAPPDLRAYVSVDIETSGPSPSLHALLAIGACSVADLSRTFYVELKPTSPRVEAEAMAVHGLSLEDLSRSGLDRPEAMRRFEAWTLALVPAGAAPVFVSYNAPFDWMFINDAFHGTLGRNPFGHAALDIRALYMGQSGEPGRPSALTICSTATCAAAGCHTTLWRTRATRRLCCVPCSASTRSMDLTARPDARIDRTVPHRGGATCTLREPSRSPRRGSASGIF